MAKFKERKISDLTTDPRNINKGSEQGMDLLEKSLHEVGAARAVVTDKNGVIIAGNKTVEAWKAIGRENIIEVETDGDKLVVVRRRDLDINSEKGVKAKILDNTVSKHNYVEDAQVSEAICEEYNLDAETYGLDEHEKEEATAIKKVAIEPYRKTHVLLSFPPDKLIQIQTLIEQIMKVDGVEVEQSSN
jgi:hypothetical protein